jgi:PAS domain S-box-containing protein
MPMSPGPTRQETREVIDPPALTPEARLFALSLDLLGLAGFDGYLKLVNPAWESVLGWTPEEIYARPYLEIIHPEDRERTAAEALSLASDRTETRDFEIRVLCKDGGHRWIVFSAHSTAEDELLYIVGKDVTERRTREIQIQLQQDVTAQASQADSVDGALQIALRLVCRLTGWSFGKSWRLNEDDSLLLPGISCGPTRPELRAFDEACNGYTFARGEGLPGRVWQSGEAEWVADVGRDENSTRAPFAREANLTQGFAAPVLLDSGDLVAVIEFFAHEEHPEDSRLLAIVSAVAAELGTVIVRKATEEALVETEARFRSIAESASEAILLADQSADILFWNTGAAAMFGYWREDVLGEPLSMLLAESDRDAHRAALDEVAAAGEGGHTIELTGLRKDGTEFPLELSIASWESAHGRYYGEIIRDVTERHSAHEELLRREQQLQLAQGIAHIGSWEWDLETNAVSWSDEMYRIYGLDPGSWDLNYGEFLQRVHPEDRAKIERTISESLESHEPFGYEHRLVWPDGTVRTVLAHGEVIVEDGRAVRMIGTGQDVTERKANEDALARSNTDLANFAYVASHDLSEPLRIVSGYVELLASRYRGQLDEQADQFIEYALNAVSRMQKLISDLLAYSSVGSVPITSGLVDMNAVVRDALSNLARMVDDRGAEVEVDELPAVRGDEGLLGRLFQNLISNGVKFSSQAHPKVTVSSQRAEGGWRFTITDNGIGIPPDDRRRIFQMFERGRARDGYPGTGMGLAICKRIVEQHGGDIWVEEAVAGGSAFQFTLPDGGVRPAATGS